MDSTTDHFYLLLIQHGEDLNMIQVEPAGVIANSGLMRTKKSSVKVFFP